MHLLDSHRIPAIRTYCRSRFSRLWQFFLFFTRIKWIYNSLHKFWCKSIRQQLILGIALVHAVLMTIFIVDLTERQRHFLQQESIQRSLAIAEMFAANSSSWVLASDVVGLSEILSYQMHYPGLEYALVTSMSGQVLAHSDAQWIGRYLTDELSKNCLLKRIYLPPLNCCFKMSII
jgi:hypothetical protein